MIPNKNECILKLLEALALETNQSFDTAGTSAIAKFLEKAINSTDTHGEWRRYLYDVRIRTIKDIESGKTHSRTSLHKLDQLARALKYQSFTDFCLTLSYPENKIISGYCGNWWSVVRANKGSFLLNAPINLSQHPDGRFVLHMKGEHSVYEGSAKLADGVLYCHLSDTQNKHIYMVMKVGKSTSPSLLQGVFSTISNAGDPICGREVWQKEEVMNFDDMRWQKVPLNSKETEPVLIAYFTNEKDNCIKINGVSSFTLSDLSSN